jgi:hypothetical protein
MQKIQLRSHVGADGILHLEIPIAFTETELNITLTVQAIALSYPPGVAANFGVANGE